MPEHTQLTLADVTPVRPYGGEHGHVEVDTSAERATRLAHLGATQSLIVRRVTAAADFGATVAELRALLDLHHGTASGALSELHLGGVLARLTQRRGGCRVYVHPRYVDGRETDRPASTARRAAEAELLGEVLTLLDEGRIDQARALVRGALEARS